MHFLVYSVVDEGRNLGLIREESQSDHLQGLFPLLVHSWHGCKDASSHWVGREKQSHCDHTVTAGSNNLIIMMSVAGQFPVSSLVIYCALHARHRPQTLCLLTAIIGSMLLQCQGRCTCFGTDHLQDIYYMKSAFKHSKHGSEIHSNHINEIIIYLIKIPYFKANLKYVAGLPGVAH